MAVRRVDALKAAYQTDWERLQPYLKAFVGGKHAGEKFTDEDDARYRRSRNLLWGWSAAITIVVCVFTQAVGIFAIAVYAFVSFIGPMIGVATMHAVNELFGNGVNTAALEKTAQFVGAALMLAAVPWFITKSALGHGRMKRVRARQYYLRNFKALHAKRGAAFNWSAACFWLWPAYRGLFAWAGALFVLVLALLWVDGHMHVGKLPAWYRGARIAVIVGLFIAIGMTATRIYFRHAMQAVAAVLALPQEEALKQLQERGGTQAWLMPVLVIALIGAAQFVIA